MKYLKKTQELTNESWTLNPVAARLDENAQKCFKIDFSLSELKPSVSAKVIKLHALFDSLTFILKF